MSVSGRRVAAPQPQQPRAVLSEEEYQRNLGEVIQRQYYPDLADLQAQASVQRRLAAGDVEGAEAIRRAAGLLKLHDALVQRAEQEEEEGGRGLGDESGGGGAAASNLRSKPRPLHLETLTGFHARVTSEDNADFEAAQSEEMRQSRIDRAKMLLLASGAGHGVTGHSQPAPNPPRLLPGGADTPLFLASDAFDAPPSATRPRAKGAPVENALFFVPSINDSEPSRGGREVEEEDSNQRLLMPPPPSQSTQALLAATASSPPLPILIPTALVEYIPKKQIERRIEPANTRFPTQSPLTSWNLAPSLGWAHDGRGRRHLEGEADDDESTREGSTTAFADDSEDTDLDRDSVDGSSVASGRLSELRRQARKRKEREWRTPVPPLPGEASPSASAISRREQAVPAPTTDPTSSSSSSFQLPPTLPREVVAERAHELSQRRSKRAGQASSSSSSPSSIANHRGGAADSQQSVRSVLSGGSFSSSSRSRRPGPALASRSALGTALRSAYDGRIGPGSVVGGGGSGSASARSRRSSLSSTSTTTHSRRDLPSPAVRPRVAK